MGSGSRVAGMVNRRAACITVRQRNVERAAVVRSRWVCQIRQRRQQPPYAGRWCGKCEAWPGWRITRRVRNVGQRGVTRRGVQNSNPARNAP